LQEKEKMFVKLQMSSAAVIFLVGNFSKVRPEKYDFFPYKVVVSFIFWPFLTKILENFGKMCFTSVHSTILPILEETFANAYMNYFWEKSPDMKDNQGKFQPNSSNFENGKISKLPFFNDK
jgi:hypothetical protein